MGALLHRRLGGAAKATSAMALNLRAKSAVTRVVAMTTLLKSSPRLAADPPLNLSTVLQWLFGRAIRFAPDGDFWRILRQFGALFLFAPKSFTADRDAKVALNATEGDARATGRAEARRSLDTTAAGDDVVLRYDVASVDEEARREAAFAGESSCETDFGSTSDKKLDADKEISRKDLDADKELSRKNLDAGKEAADTELDADKDTNAVFWGLFIKGPNFLRVACLHFAALPQSLLRWFSNLTTDGLRGSTHLTHVKSCVNPSQFLFCSIGFHLIRGAQAQDQTDNGKPVDPEVWETSDYAKVVAMTLLASSIGGVGVAVWILYNRRKTFPVDDIDEGLMSGPAVVRRSDPVFALPPPLEL